MTTACPLGGVCHREHEWGHPCDRDENEDRTEACDKRLGASKVGKRLDTAMRWALVRFATDLKTQEAEDRANACAENGWLMRDASGLYTHVINTLADLATGRLSPDEYLEQQRQESLEQTR